MEFDTSDVNYKNRALTTPGSDTAPLLESLTNTYGFNNQLDGVELNTNGFWDSRDYAPNGDWDDSLVEHAALGSQIAPANEDEGLSSHLTAIENGTRLEQDQQMVEHDDFSLGGREAFQLGTEGQIHGSSAGTNNSLMEDVLSSSAELGMRSAMLLASYEVQESRNASILMDSSTQDQQLLSETNRQTLCSWEDWLIDSWSDESPNCTSAEDIVSGPQHLPRVSIATKHPRLADPTLPRIPEQNSTLDPRVLTEIHEQANHEHRRRESGGGSPRWVLGTGAAIAAAFGIATDADSKFEQCEKGQEADHNNPVEGMDVETRLRDDEYKPYPCLYCSKSFDLQCFLTWVCPL